MAKMHRAGIRLDDAATAAKIADQELRNQRDELIHAADDLGLSLRQISKIFRLSFVRISQVLNHGTKRLTP